ncbi:lasso peptide biosynthesis B2 protein [Falsibacillus pallidus]|uniref:Transglutaminase superfamily protein n=1 Tax=Falsibacillus pallidus TaxID=493781 RepID=A0A370GPN5_9BACI|nr:lasso peptide biosynthesis B2 protein [Falsibacillus pallidus]RDI45698.1 transglutaminase superfamily protein [Falsibacillus pallidus]
MIVNKLRGILQLDRTRRALLFEAYFSLAWARILKSIPFSQTSKFLGDKMMETPYALNANQTELLTNIMEAIQIMSRHTFWESKCLVQAIAGMKMLERRKIDSTLYLGTAKDLNGDFIAHAWLRSGNLFITGAERMKEFTVVGKFANKCK